MFDKKHSFALVFKSLGHTVRKVSMIIGADAGGAFRRHITEAVPDPDDTFHADKLQGHFLQPSSREQSFSERYLVLQ